MNLFQSIFGGGEKPGRYPESLIELAIERAVEATDVRLRLLRGYGKRLREPVILAIDHVVALVDGIPDPVRVGGMEYGDEPRLAALFVSAEDMLQRLGQDTALAELLHQPGVEMGGRITALLMAERRERNVLGMDLLGDQVQREVAQVAVSFSGHRLLDPQYSEVETRRLLKRRAFDHLLGLALGQMTDLRMERADLGRQQALLQRKLRALEGSGWGFDPLEGEPGEPQVLLGELEALEAQLAALGEDDEILARHLEILSEVLSQASHQLWAEQISLYLDSMNIQRDPLDPRARPIILQELHNPRGQRVVMLPISFRPGELPPREDFLAAAERYGY